MGLMTESTTGTGYLGGGVHVLLIAALAGCALPGGQDDREPTQPTPTIADDWNQAILDMGKVPVLPPTEDMYVGDVYALPAPPDYSGTDTSDWLTAATPRWKSLQVHPNRCRRGPPCVRALVSPTLVPLLPLVQLFSFSLRPLHGRISPFGAE